MSGMLFVVIIKGKHITELSEYVRNGCEIMLLNSGPK